MDNEHNNNTKGTNVYMTTTIHSTAYNKILILLVNDITTCITVKQLNSRKD